MATKRVIEYDHVINTASFDLYRMESQIAIRNKFMLEF